MAGTSAAVNELTEGLVFIVFLCAIASLRLNEVSLFADEMRCNAPFVWRVAVFPQVNPLPGPQDEAALDKRDREIHHGQSASDMRGHVVVAFGGVDKQRITVRNKPREKALQIATHIRVSIL